MNTFQKKITFLSKVATPQSDGNGIEWQDSPITKTATFKEISQTDKSQHKLHFKILSLLEGFKAEDGATSANIDSDALYDITVKAINNLILIDENFTAQDKSEFLSDSLAILSFGLWLLTEKLMPFFSKFKTN